MRVSAARWIAERCTEGKASQYIHHYKDVIRPGTKVLLCLRESTERNRPNLDDQEAWLREKAKSKGAIVVRVVRHVGASQDHLWLRRAARIAKKYGAEYLLAESTDRYVRNGGFSPQFNADAQPTDYELKNSMRWADGMPLVTWLHPDAAPSLVRSHQRQRGWWAKDRKRPGYKKAIRIEERPLVLQLHSEGKSIPEIMELTGRPRRTIYRWIKHAKACVPFLPDELR
jgi:hypothetical protein